MAEFAGDKCTIVSIVPFPVEMEEKPGVYPGRFSIPAAKNGVPQVLVVGKSTAPVPMPGDRPPLIMDIASAEIARSIVEDYLSSQLVATPDAHPGLAWLPGELTVEEVLVRHAALITELNVRQRRWFLVLVELADTDWARHHSHRVIADFQRFACTELGLTREWNVEIEVDARSPVRCPACKSVVPADTIVCPTCRCVLDREKFKEMQFA